MCSAALTVVCHVAQCVCSEMVCWLGRNTVCGVKWCAVCSEWHIVDCTRWLLNPFMLIQHQVAMKILGMFCL